MKVMNIIHDSVVDGEGLRTVVFFAGCPHHCLGCHNPKSWNLYNGTEMSVKEIIKEISTNPLTDVTFSGGDPFFQSIEVKEVAKAVKSLNKNLWIYTGYTLEEIQNSQNKDMIELLHYGDVLVDGRFEIEKRDLTLPFRGSSNQRIIRLK
ncbi:MULTISPECIES: anaerobic ribonucleoside-triphosphate reductase activating protein [Bacillus cereus group]|uniref:anaerobic ribonucleoside-triphosphate reductase activating protein n=1 Tax=Bacillus cereus group TaxID=86661 RepID=UPI000BECF6BA|nr:MULTISPECIES: anaerobic ribonucleoside-triphosphate reductase activating protein [Bacillus cereus group]MBJ7966304.1 anaerobic ribonucleoside-triphosphate reductase activating protein [Bacillus cereus]MBJ8002146.1 anaerobic ribonucleoside-triphosphate reductase activating protein [Bacillus cereus]PDY98489.1 anaerobic ribonucleoside-triphosphate reductase activating protein [Bacillus thuringiensis]PGV55553.1 anaerobic ribonucleoside-triphosphate reductase activating protein [Bacillus thuringi